MKASEKGLIVIALLAITGWILPTFDIKIDATAVAIVAMIATFVCGIISWNDLLKTKAAWNTLIWFGGILGLSSALTKGKFFEWLAKYLEAHMNFGLDLFMMLILISIISVVVRYFFASGTAYISPMLPVFLIVGINAGIDPCITCVHHDWYKCVWWFRNSLRCSSWSNHLLRWLQQCKRLVDSWSHLRRCMFSIELRNWYPLVENYWFHVI